LHSGIVRKLFRFSVIPHAWVAESLKLSSVQSMSLEGFCGFGHKVTRNWRSEFMWYTFLCELVCTSAYAVSHRYDFDIRRAGWL